MAALVAKAQVGIVLIFLSCSSALGKTAKLHSAENEQFEIVGLDARSVYYVDDLSRYIVKTSEPYLKGGNFDFPQRVLISLKPAKYVNFEGDYEIQIGQGGFVNLNLRWEESLSLYDTCQALTEAFLVRFALLNYGERGLNHLPKWLVTAIGTKAYYSLRPAQLTRLTAQLREEARPAIEALLDLKRTEESAGMMGYAFLMALQRSGIPKSKISAFVSYILSGNDAVEGLIILVSPNASGEVNLSLLNEWWVDAFDQLKRPAEEPVEEMEASRAWLQALADFSNTEFKEYDLNQLWDERDNEALRDLVEARYEILRLRIVRVNPAYFNAARSLGALYESFLHEGKRYKYVHRLTVFLGDFEDSKDLEETVRQALAQASGESTGN